MKAILAPIKSLYFVRKFLYFPLFLTGTVYFSYQIFQKVAGRPAIEKSSNLALIWYCDGPILSSAFRGLISKE